MGQSLVRKTIFLGIPTSRWHGLECLLWVGPCRSADCQELTAVGGQQSFVPTLLDDVVAWTVIDLGLLAGGDCGLVLALTPK
jgi:hypothetical protein